MTQEEDEEFILRSKQCGEELHSIVSLVQECKLSDVSIHIDFLLKNSSILVNKLQEVRKKYQDFLNCFLKKVEILETKLLEIATKKINIKEDQDKKLHVLDGQKSILQRLRQKLEALKKELEEARKNKEKTKNKENVRIKVASDQPLYEVFTGGLEVLYGQSAGANLQMDLLRSEDDCGRIASSIMFCNQDILIAQRELALTQFELAEMAVQMGSLNMELVAMYSKHHCNSSQIGIFRRNTAFVQASIEFWAILEREMDQGELAQKLAEAAKKKYEIMLSSTEALELPFINAWNALFSEADQESFYLFHYKNVCDKCDSYTKIQDTVDDLLICCKCFDDRL